MAEPARLWAAQHLARDAGDPVAVATDAVGVYGTAPTCYLSLAARVAGLTVAAVDELIYERRALVRARCMRGSVYLLPRDLLVIATAATREKNRKSYRAMLESPLGPGGYDVWADRVEAALAAGPMGARDIRLALDPPREVAKLLSFVVAGLAAEGRVVRATVRGGWRSDLHEYARWSDWLPDVDPHAIGVAAAQAELAGAYFAAYGPATLGDFRWWAGFTQREARAATAAAGLVPAGEGPDGPYLATDNDAALGHPPPVRLLPVWDMLLVAYRHRERLIPDGSHHQVYDRFGNATATVLVDGRVAGVWDLGPEADELTLKVSPFTAFSPRVWEAVREEAGRIGALAGAESVRVVRCGPPPDLVAAPRNRFLSPLRDCAG